ncbi:MAG: DUF3048 domain-containing protein [Lachnospiraceae bacterium]|nr:DUF3048 domain-containing protein [Lachnospiraceae bacterium]
MKRIKKFLNIILVTAVFGIAVMGCDIGVPDESTSATTPEATSPNETTTDDIVIEITTPGEKDNSDSETTTPEETTTSEPDRENMVKSYLTGKWVDKAIGTKRPIAVMFNNIMVAVPQSGIENADIVYETPVEGGITRLVGIMEDYSELDKIGSVRSARLYHGYIALEFDAIFVHYGSAIYANDLLKNHVDNVDGNAGEGTVAYYRTEDRKAPHNAYTSAEHVAAGIKYKNYRTDYSDTYGGHFKFAEDGERVSLATGKNATRVALGYINNSPWFEYDSKDNLYYRYQFKSAQFDQETGSQLAYDNIIIQFVDYYDYGDGYYYIYNQGSGTGKYITGGKYIDITWKKDDEFGITKYYNEAGEEIILNQGKTWVSMIFDTRMSSVVID